MDPDFLLAVTARLATLAATSRCRRRHLGSRLGHHRLLLGLLGTTLVPRLLRLLDDRTEAHALLVRATLLHRLHRLLDVSQPLIRHLD